MRKFELFIVGTQKAGTTALAEFLGQHPEISAPAKKELHIFDDPAFETLSQRAIDDRFATFRTSDDHIHFDATPIYMYKPIYMKRLKIYNPDAKIIVLLRDPVERALSHYFMERARKNERWPLVAAICFEPFRLKFLSRFSASYRDRSSRYFSYCDRGHYLNQIDQLNELFPSNNILVVHNQDLANHHEHTLKIIYDFLGLKDRTFIANEEVVFSGQGSRATRVSRALVTSYLGRKLADDIEFAKSAATFT